MFRSSQNYTQKHALCGSVDLLAWLKSNTFSHVSGPCSSQRPSSVGSEVLPVHVHSGFTSDLHLFAFVVHIHFESQLINHYLWDHLIVQDTELIHLWSQCNCVCSTPWQCSNLEFLPATPPRAVRMKIVCEVPTTDRCVVLDSSGCSSHNKVGIDSGIHSQWKL